MPTRSVTSAFILGARIALGARDPDPAAVLDAAIGGIGRADLDEHVLLQFGEPRIGTGLLAAALILDKTTRREDERELLGYPLLHRRLLHGEADIGHSELLGVGQRRIFRDQVDARRVDRLAVNRNRIGQAERIHARLAVAVGHAAVHQRDALDAARQVERPRHRVGIGGIDPVDRGHFGLGKILVPAELLQDSPA